MIFVGDDWAEDHHDIHLMDDDRGRLASRRLPEGLAGIGEFHELIAAHAEEPEPGGDRHRNRPGPVGGGLDARPDTRCMRSTRWRWPATATGTTSRAPSPMPVTPNCWPIWCAPTGTTTAGSPATAPRPRRSRCSPGHTRI